jgi:hypothetical protein
MSTVNRLVNRLAERGRLDAAAIASTSCTHCTPEQRLGMTFAPGDVVVDLVTGQRGVIRAGQPETYLVPSTKR